MWTSVYCLDKLRLKHKSSLKASQLHLVKWKKCSSSSYCNINSMEQQYGTAYYTVIKMCKRYVVKVFGWRNFLCWICHIFFTNLITNFIVLSCQHFFIRNLISSLWGRCLAHFTGCRWPPPEGFFHFVPAPPVLNYIFWSLGPLLGLINMSAVFPVEVNAKSCRF